MPGLSGKNAPTNNCIGLHHNVLDSIADVHCTGRFMCRQMDMGRMEEGMSGRTDYMGLRRDIYINSFLYRPIVCMTGGPFGRLSDRSSDQPCNSQL